MHVLRLVNIRYFSIQVAGILSFNYIWYVYILKSISYLYFHVKTNKCDVRYTVCSFRIKYPGDVTWYILKGHVPHK